VFVSPTPTAADPYQLRGLYLTTLPPPSFFFRSELVKTISTRMGPLPLLWAQLFADTKHCCPLKTPSVVKLLSKNAELAKQTEKLVIPHILFQ